MSTNSYTCGIFSTLSVALRHIQNECRTDKGGTITNGNMSRLYCSVCVIINLSTGGKDLFRAGIKERDGASPPWKTRKALNIRTNLTRGKRWTVRTDRCRK